MLMWVHLFGLFRFDWFCPVVSSTCSTCVVVSDVGKDFFYSSNAKQYIGGRIIVEPPVEIAPGK